MRIKNFRKLATSPASTACLKILEAGLDAINPEKALRALVKVQSGKLVVGSKKFPLPKRLYVVGAGKASGVMASVLEKILGNHITKGLIIDVTKRRLKHIKVAKGDHPVLSPNNVRLTKDILRMTKNLHKEDLVICLISGGGSALFADPRIPIEQYQKLTKGLLKSGATIQEVNTVRKHVDGVKGGRFAAHCAPATVVSLLVSDVPGNNPVFIASGPTVHDTTTAKDAQKILAKYRLPQIPVSETPKEPMLFKRVHNIMALDNVKAVKAMAAEAKKLRLTTRVLSTKLSGEARETGIKLLNALGNRRKSAIIAAGETTVTVTGHGRGGRNQEVVLGAVHLLSSMPGSALASMGSDGIDNTPFAGAIADDKTAALERKKILSCIKFLENNNAFVYWKKMKRGIVTGPTGTNVSDILVAVRL